MVVISYQLKLLIVHLIIFLHDFIVKSHWFKACGKLDAHYYSPLISLNQDVMKLSFKHINVCLFFIHFVMYVFAKLGILLDLRGRVRM